MISVCIATYNGEKYIKEQLSSILSQLSDQDEIIISDDQSADQTLQEIRSINDPRIHIYTHKKDFKALFSIDNCIHNFVNAMKQAKGDIIFLSDQDDVWLPDKVKTMTLALQHSDLVMSDCSITDEKLNIKTTSYTDCRPFKTSILSNFIKSSYLGSCMAFRRAVFERALPFPKHGVGHDLWLGMVARRWFNVSYVAKPLMLYRRHEETITYCGMKNRTSLLFKIAYRLFILKALFRLLI